MISPSANPELGWEGTPTEYCTDKIAFLKNLPLVRIVPGTPIKFANTTEGWLTAAVIRAPVNFMQIDPCLRERGIARLQSLTCLQGNVYSNLLSLTRSHLRGQSYRVLRVQSLSWIFEICHIGTVHKWTRATGTPLELWTYANIFLSKRNRKRYCKQALQKNWRLYNQCKPNMIHARKGIIRRKIKTYTRLWKPGT